MFAGLGEDVKVEGDPDGFSSFAVVASVESVALEVSAFGVMPEAVVLALLDVRISPVVLVPEVFVLMLVKVSADIPVVIEIGVLVFVVVIIIVEVLKAVVTTV